MSDRLTDRRIDALTRHVDGVFVNNTTTVALAREVQASRKLIADLLALCNATDDPWRSIRHTLKASTVLRLIEEATR